MRFQQLKKDPNNVLKNKLVKSGKTWIVISSLALTSGLFLINNTTVKADSISNNQPTETQAASSNNGQPVQSKNIDNSNTIKPETESQNDSAETTGPTVNEQVQTRNPVQIQSEDTPITPTNTGNSDESVNPTPSTDSSFQVPSDATYKGNFSNNSDSSQWYIDSQKTLHIGPGKVGVRDYQQSPFEKYSENIDSISLEGNVVGTDEYSTGTNKAGITGLFSNLKNIDHIDGLENLDVSNVSSLDSLFKNDSSLKSLDLSSWDTANVTQMAGVFDGDISLTDLKLSSKWKTDNVVDMTEMFKNTNISNFDFSSWNTSKVQTFSSMFYYDFKKITKAPQLKSIDISNFDMQSAYAIDNMFGGQTNLETIKLPKDAHTYQVENMYFMFYDDQSLKSIDISGLNDTYSLSHDTNLVFFNIFDDNPSLESVTVGPNNTMDSSFSLPEKFAKGSDTPIVDTWINVGKGTIKEPEGSIFLKNVAQNPNDDVSSDPSSTAFKVYNGSKDAPMDIFVPKRTEVTADVTIDSNLGNKVVYSVTGTVGKIIDVPVPSVSGYTSDKAKIKAHVYNDNTIIPLEKVTYTKNGSSTNTHHSNSDNNNSGSTNVTTDTVKHDQDVATYYDKPNVNLYDIQNNHQSSIADRELGNGTDWFSDETLTTDNTEYYRVATGEFVKASQVYPYYPISTNIQTNIQTNKQSLLYTAEGKLVTDRALAANTAWYTDRFIYLNNEKYYRVATNEFVKATDIRLNY